MVAIIEGENTEGSERGYQRQHLRRGTLVNIDH